MISDCKYLSFSFRAISKLIFKKVIEYGIIVCSNYARPKYWELE